MRDPRDQAAVTLASPRQRVQQRDGRRGVRRRYRGDIPTEGTVRSPSAS